MQDGQPLPDALSGLENIALQRFCWRGRNRHADRYRAAQELRDVLVRQTGDHPEAEHHVIAHSHGGNVALYAVGGDDKALSQVSVTTLGTPFLAMTPRPVPRWFIIIALIGTAIMIGNLWEWGFGQHEDESSRIAWLWLLYYSAFAALGTMAILFVGMSALLYRRAGTSGWFSLLRGTSVASEAPRVSSPSLADDRLFVVLAHGDEAAALLGTGVLASWILKKALSLLRPTLWLTLVAIVAFAFIPEDSSALIPASWLGLAPLVAISGFVFLLTFAYLPFGIDMLFWTLHAAVTGGPSPSGYTVGFQAGSPDGDGLAHSVYHDPQVIEIVASRIGSPPERTPGA